ncbi:MAG: MFS transporter [Cellulomonadaceae bacterium]
MTQQEPVAGGEPDGQDAPAPTLRTWVGLWVLAAGLSLIVIDGTIVGVSLPTIIAELDLDLTDAQWVNGLYAVVFAALLLSTGRLGDRMGRRTLFIAGLVVFMGGSLLAAGAEDAPQLIWARVVQGVGGACILPGTLSTVNATFRGRDRAVAFGIWGAVMSGAAALGPLLGGWLTSTFSWEWIFLVNVPLGLLVLVGAVLTVPQTRGAVSGRGVDVDGLQLSVLGLGALVFAIIEGSSLGWWRPLQDFSVLGFTWPATRPVSIIPIVGAIGLVSLALFVLWERHRAREDRSAILDLALFRIPTFSWGNITAATVAIGEFAIVFVLPLFLVNALAMGTMGAGLVLAAMAVGAFCSAASARHLSARFGAPTVVLLGLGLEVAGVVAVALVVSASVSAWLVAALLTVYGLGLGLASAQLTSTVLRDVPTGLSGEGSATQSTVRQVGAAIGAAVSGAVLSIGMAHAFGPALAGVSGLDTHTASGLAEGARSSAGSLIAGLREQGTSGTLGDLGPQVVRALSDGFAEATRWALLAAAVFVLLGMVGAARVRAAGRRGERLANAPDAQSVLGASDEPDGRGPADATR